MSAASHSQQLRDFAQAWLRRPLTPQDGVQVPSHLRLPAVLRTIYNIFGAVPEFTTVHNKLLAPADIVHVVGYVIFYDENQCVVRWAFREADLHLDDPTVYQGSGSDNGYEWFSEELTLSEWIRVSTLWQLVCGGFDFNEYATGVSGATETVAANYPLITAHESGAVQFYGSPTCLICLTGSPSSPGVWIGTVTNKELVKAKKILF